MRVIAGSAKGTRLTPPKDQSARPTLDRVREALFSILGERIVEARVLDLYAGTGAIGIEALSRGAAGCDFVESARAGAALIAENLNRAKLGDRARIYPFRLPEGLSGLSKQGAAYEFIYADPPFEYTDYGALLADIAALDLLSAEGILVIEHDSKSDLGENSAGLRRFREAVYGRTTLSFYEADQD